MCFSVFETDFLFASSVKSPPPNKKRILECAREQSRYDYYYYYHYYYYYGVMSAINILFLKRGHTFKPGVVLPAPFRPPSRRVATMDRI